MSFSLLDVASSMINQVSNKERVILVPKLPKIATRCRLSDIQTKIGSLNFM